MRWLAGIAVAAIAVLLFFAVRERATARATHATTAEEPAPAGAKPERPANEAIVISKAFGGTGEPVDEVPPESEPAPERRPDPPWVEERVEEAPAPDDDPVHITGTLSVEGDAAPNGTFRLTGGPLDWSTVEVRAGAWSATVPSGSKLGFDRIYLGERLALAVDPEMLVPPSGKMAVTCRWFAPTVLRVVDADTGAELTGIEIDWGYMRPGPVCSPLITGASSPVTLPEEPGERAYWVRAQEHAWTRLKVVQGFGGERVVRLPRAGTLDVKLSNLDPRSGAEVRLGTMIGDNLLSWPAAEHVRIDSLAPGQYDVRVEFGSSYRNPLRLAEEPLVEIEAGGVREVALTLASVPGPEGLVPLAGTLHVDAAWGEARKWADIKVRGVKVPPGTDDPKVELPKDGRWSAGRVAPGRYFVSVEPFDWGEFVDVGPAGNPDVRIVVPPPCDVEVRVLFADRDEAAPVNTLYWGSYVEWGPRGGYKRAEARPGWFRFQAMPGEVEFEGDNFQIEDRVFTLEPGLNRITLRAKRTYCLEVELRDAATGMKLPVDDGFWPRITAVGVDDRECRAADTPFSSRIRVTKPGRYRVMFLAEIEGFRSIDDQEVDVPAEGVGLLVVRLKRR